MRIYPFLAFSFSAALLATPAVAQDIPVRPTFTYLQAFRDSTAQPRVFSGKEDALDPESGILGFSAVDLDALGHRPGDIVSLSTFGGTRFAPSDPDPAGTLRGALAVFSLHDEVLSRRNLNRVTGAIDVLGVTEAVTGPTPIGNRPTDIPEDFLLRESPFDVEIPEGARFLHFAVNDSSHADNLPGDPQTHIRIVGTTGSIPEPGAGLLLGVAAVLAAGVSRGRGV